MSLKHAFKVKILMNLGHDGKLPNQNIVPKYNGIFHAFQEIYRQEGLRGLFKGLHMSLLSQAFASSFYFWMYIYIESKL
jgi:hypothetical protein